MPAWLERDQLPAGLEKFGRTSFDLLANALAHKKMRDNELVRPAIPFCIILSDTPFALG